MKDWNVVISVYQDGFRRTLRALKEFGPVERSPYYNVLVMKADNPTALLETIEQRTEENKRFMTRSRALHRRPAPSSFIRWRSLRRDLKRFARMVTRLTGISLHVRLHRRGDRHDLRTLDAERLLDDMLLDATAAAGAPCKISFTDPDAVIAIDTVDDRAGIGLWTREDLTRHHLLRPD